MLASVKSNNIGRLSQRNSAAEFDMKVECPCVQDAQVSFKITRPLANNLVTDSIHQY